MKIKEVSSSFSMKKNLGNYQTADMWFSQTVEIDEKENEEEVAQKVYDFCKKMALKQYNEFDVKVVPKKTPEEEYAVMPGFEETRKALSNLTIRKPWTCDLGHVVTGERCLNKEHYADSKEHEEAVVYYAKNREGEKGIVNKADNTEEPK